MLKERKTVFKTLEIFALQCYLWQNVGIYSAPRPNPV